VNAAHTDARVGNTLEVELASAEATRVVEALTDDARSFYEPERIGAQLLRFHHGWVEYRFPSCLFESGSHPAAPTSVGVRLLEDAER